ncbi:MAG: hypothetical protein K2O49_07240, partial [Muribaculaceae bacterium]|nr:hypothetical protein [Muribaculaceae bacterium]
ALAEQMVEKYAQEVVKDPKSREMLSQNSVNRKTFEAIKENVSLDNKEVSVEEFRELFAPKAEA